MVAIKQIQKLLRLRKRAKKFMIDAPFNDKAVFLEAGQEENLDGNMFAILKAIECEAEWKEYIPFWVVTAATKDLVKERFELYNFHKVCIIERNTKEYWKMLNTCKYVMTDDLLPSLYSKREGQIYLNICYGTSLEFHEESDIKNIRSLNNLQRNFFLCDYILFPNKDTQQGFMRHYMLDRTFQGTCVYASSEQDVTDRLLRLVLCGDEQQLTTEKVQDERKSIIYHVGTLQNSVHRELVKDLAKQIDYRNNNITLCIEGKATQAKLEVLETLPKEIYYYFLDSAEGITPFEKISMFLFTRWGLLEEKVQTYLKRETQRLFYGWKPDEINLFTFRRVKYAYFYGTMQAKKVFHELPDACLGYKIFKQWYAFLKQYIKHNYDEVKCYAFEDVKKQLSQGDCYSTDIEFRISRMKVRYHGDSLKVKLSMQVACYDEVDFSSFQLLVGTQIYTPAWKIVKKSFRNYYRWTVSCDFSIPFEDASSQELQNKICVIRKNGNEIEKKIQILYTKLWKRIYRRKPVTVYSDKERGLTYFFRMPKETFTLTIREKNVTDEPKERVKVAIAFLLSRLAFFYKPILLYEKNAARYEESASVLYEKLLDKGYKNVYFVLDKEYPFKDTVPERYRDHIVDKYSFKHYFCFFTAKTFIGSEAKGHAFELRPISRLVTWKINRSKHNYIFLQHGVMYMISLDSDRRGSFRAPKNKKIRQRTIVSSELERDHFVELGGYKESDLYLCGLPKYDRNIIYDEPKNIVIMLTWRPWEFIKSIDHMEETSYFKMVCKIVEHIPKEYHKHLLVLPHPLIEEKMRTTDNALKQFIPEVAKYDDILKDTKILITDYSSISYDAFYRGCNVIFCWQEKEQCLAEYGVNAKLMLTQDLAFGDVNYDYKELPDIVKYNYTHPQTQKHLSNYAQVVNFHDGKNTERLIEMMIADKML